MRTKSSAYSNSEGIQLWYITSRVTGDNIHENSKQQWTIYRPLMHNNFQMYQYHIYHKYTWLENVEEYMAELEIDREDICIGKNWRRNAMNRNSNPIVNRTINLYYFNEIVTLTHMPVFHFPHLGTFSILTSPFLMKLFTIDFRSKLSNSSVQTFNIIFIKVYSTYNQSMPYSHCRLQTQLIYTLKY